MQRLVRREPLSRRQTEHVEAIGTSANSLLGIISDILDISKIEAGQFTIENREFSLIEVLDMVQELLEAKALENNCSLSVIHDVHAPRLLMGDPLRLRQVLLNIVGNAVKFSPGGTVCLEVKTTHFEPGHCQIDFVIKDTGIGMSEEELRQVLLPFTQADSSISRRFGGTGLGLTISQKLIQLQGGQIEIESVKDEGSTFRFSLPFGAMAGRVYRGRGYALPGDSPKQASPVRCFGG
jgi:signal transduction histidine kinase